MILCSPQLGLSPESNLGGEVHDREMLKALDELGVQSLIILPFGKKHPSLKHAKIYFLPTPFVYPPWLFNLLVLPYLFFLQWKYKFDVLRVHSPYFVGPAALLFQLFYPKVKVIASYLHLEKDNDYFNILDKLLIHRFSFITTISESTREDIIKRYGVDLKNITIIPCGVDAKYKSLPKNQKLVKKYQLANKKVLLYLGQLIERKNIPFLFKVLKKLPKSYVLMVCGDGPLRQELENKAPGNVIFTGQIPEKDKVDYYNLADVFVYPSRLEGFGLSVLEAIACGKLVVVSDIPAFKEICKGQKGCILIPLNGDKWAKAIIASMSKRGPRYISRNYSWEKPAGEYLKLISP